MGLSAVPDYHDYLPPVMELPDVVSGGNPNCEDFLSPGPTIVSMSSWYACDVVNAMSNHAVQEIENRRSTAGLSRLFSAIGILWNEVVILLKMLPIFSWLPEANECINTGDCLSLSEYY